MCYNRMPQLIILYTIFSLCIFASLAHADYSMTLDTTISMSLNSYSVFDVQYWMNEVVVGYAFANNDTLFCVPQLGDSMRSLHIPDCPSVWGDSTGFSCVAALRLVRLETHPQSPIVAAACWDENVVCSRCYLLIIDFDADTVIFSTPLGYQNCNYDDPYNEVRDFSCWPPPPDISASITITATHYQHIGWGGEYSEIWHYGEARFWKSGWTNCRGFGAFAASPFRIYTSEPLFATWNSYYYNFYEEGEDTVYRDQTVYQEFSTVDSSRQQRPTFTYCENDSPCGGTTIVAQTDGDGTKRLISTREMAAYDPDMWEVLWQRPPVNNSGIFAARMPDCADERILILNSNSHMAILSAEDGSFIDSIRNMQGTPASVIKRRNHPDQIVTRSGSTVCVYDFYDPPEVEKLTICTMGPQSSTCRLWWQPVAGASEYRIEASQNVNGAYLPIVSVPATQLNYDVPLSGDTTACFFQVIAVFDSMR